MTNIDPDILFHVGFLILFFYSFYHPFLKISEKRNSILSPYLLNSGYLHFIPIYWTFSLWETDLQYNQSNFGLTAMILFFCAFFLNHIQLKWSSIDSEKEQLINMNRNLNLQSKSILKKREFLTKSIDALTILSPRNLEIEKVKKNILEIISSVFESEFCSIGTLNNNMIKDEYSISLKNSINDTIGSCNKEGSLIGSIIESGQDFYWSLNDSDLSLAQTVEKKFSIEMDQKRILYYEEEILESSKHKNLYIKGLYNDGKPYGFLHLINFDDTDSLNELTSYLGSIEKIINNYERISLILKDEKKVNSAYQTNNINKAINDVIKYISEEFMSDITSFWVPLRDGIDSEETDKLLLRNLYLSNNKIDLKEQIIDSHIKSLSETKFQEIFNDSIQIYNSGESKVIDNIEYSTKVIIPIKISSPFKEKHLYNMWGVFLLHYLDTPQIQLSKQVPRLEYLASNYRYLFERSIYSRRYRRIEDLGNSISSIEKESSEEFYQKFVELIKEILNCQAVSCFACDIDYTYLKLKATTATCFENVKANVKYDIAQVKLIIQRNEPIYSLISNSSLTGMGFNKGESLIVNEVMKSSYTNKTFMECTDDEEHLSILIVPLYFKETKIGVIRCINKKSADDNFYGTNFNEGDRELLELICKVIAPTLSSINFNEGMKDAITNITHETRTPLSAMLGDTELLKYHLFEQRKIKSIDISSSLNSLDMQIQLIAKLITEFSEFDEISNSDEIPTTIDTFRVYPLLSKLSDTFYKDSIEAGVLLKIHSANKNQNITISLNDLTQILNNLLRNAINYAHRGTTVTLLYKYENDRHRFLVRNNGIGIPVEEAEQIFIFKYRASNAEEHEGSGIGLFVAKTLVERNNGRIYINSYGNPTEFIIEF